MKLLIHLVKSDIQRIVHRDVFL